MPEIRTDLADRLRPLQAALRRRLARADVLAEMIRAVNASLDPERVADDDRHPVADWLPVPGWLVLAVDDAGRVRALAASGADADADGSRGARRSAALGDADGRGLRDAPICRRIAAGAAGRERAGGRGAGLSARVPGPDGRRARRRSIGRRAAQEPKFAPATLDVLLTALEPGAIALDNALRVQRAEALSVTDDLTQLYNSRYLSQVLRRETKRASRSGRPLSLLFIDLDGFKSINDTHGHLSGSRALVEAAGVIRVSARETDVVARFGGDEFALVLPDTGSDGAVAVGERVRERVAAHRFLRGRRAQHRV